MRLTGWGNQVTDRSGGGGGGGGGGERREEVGGRRWEGGKVTWLCYTAPRCIASHHTVYLVLIHYCTLDADWSGDRAQSRE